MLLDQVRPYTALGIESYVSHVTAAQLHGIPLPPWFAHEESIHLARPANGSIARRRGVKGHLNVLTPYETMLLDGVPVTTPTRTLLDLAALLTLDDLVAAADFLVCEHDRFFEEPKTAIVTASELRSYVDTKHRLRGLVNARQAMELMRIGVDSPPETKLRLMLGRSGLPEFTTNYVMRGQSHEVEVYPDLACEEYKVCGEYEGAIHETAEKQRSDARRDRRTRERGWLQVRIYNADMLRGDNWVVDKFARELRKRGWRPS